MSSALFVTKDGSGSSSDEGGFLRDGAEAEAAGDSGHTLPVRNSRSVYCHRISLISLAIFIRTLDAEARGRVRRFLFFFEHFPLPRYDLHMKGFVISLVFCSILHGLDGAFITLATKD